MMTERPRLLVIEPEPSLNGFLAEQLPDWQVVQDTGDHSPVQAALIVSGEAAHREALKLREGGMIGPIFTFADAGQGYPAPLIALSKPLRLSALTARLAEPGPAAIDGAVIGPWRLDAGQKLLSRVGQSEPERLTDKEFAVLELLLQAGAVSRERIQGEVWNYHVETETHTVETHIWRLRQKLETDPAVPEYLLTEADGYRLRRLV